MPFLNSSGDMWSGVGAAQGWLWPLNEQAPRSVGPGAAGGWRFDGQFIGSSPRGDVWSPSWGTLPEGTVIWPESIGWDSFPANVIVAGGPYWGASNGQASIGDVPPGYESWQWWAIGNDGTRVMVLNGFYRVFWPDGSDLDLNGVTVSVGDGCIVTVDGAGTLRQFVQGQVGAITPQQRPGMKYFATTVRAQDGASWLIYSSAELGKFICHRGDDASQGYILDDLTMLGPVGPCGVTLADGRTVLGWAAGPAQQGADLRRAIITLGVNMVPFVVAPEPPEPEPEPPQPEPPDPEPEPEPEPMPPVDPMKPGKDWKVYLDELAKTISTPGENFLMPFESARQGCLQAWDQQNAAKAWMSGQACVRGACSRSGQASVIVDPLLWDRVSPLVTAIDQEYLQR